MSDEVSYRPISTMCHCWVTHGGGSLFSTGGQPVLSGCGFE